MRRADEPLLLLHAAGALVARRGAEVLASLKASLAGDGTQARPPPAPARPACAARGRRGRGFPRGRGRASRRQGSGARRSCRGAFLEPPLAIC